ncbi:MFS transporter [Aspergillus novofumigatus IBT 16806]|uniref:MFS general substrate transporter n=1 Tax=Aspergillus novofumigatus (strain IBT 16806) TaxID=1392255 RepID=A0A2I1C182_ASPN1|nr:MFS general substrate transporter [Aspergillus novofumigatus IBT 16806]PKX91396.1 MFS general substrate transporter [Aspergillus novofumigatus IBT 16806]
MDETNAFTDLSIGVVGWDGPGDSRNPRNFAPSRKWLLLSFVSSITFLSPLASSINAPGVPLMNQEFHNTPSILSSLVVSIFVLGFSVGPLVLSPLSEINGRQPVLNAANIFLTAWQIGCALTPSVGALIGFRFLARVGGSACLTIGGGIISDLFPIAQRRRANAVFSIGPLFGPVIGPIIGGFIAERAGWRWVYWVLLCACGVVTLGNVVLNSETNPVVLIRRKTEKLRRTESPGTPPILLLLAVYMSFVFGMLYLLFTTLTSLYEGVYHWPPILEWGVGFLLGLIVVAKTSDATVVRLTKANNNVYEPEMRLASSVIFAFLIPVSFFWYGWTADKHVHWIAPLIGLAPFAFGMMGIFLPIQTYFIDVGGAYAASAVAGLTTLRCLFGAFLPLAGPSMCSTLGLGWGNSLLGLLSLGLIPAPALIYRYGGLVRKKFPITLG